MKVAILAGGAGSRLAEETKVRPKPMVEIGGIPILWHIMEHYAQYGHSDFVIALGYLGDYIKEYVENYCRNSRNLKVDLGTGEVEYEYSQKRDWKIELIETGLTTLTGGRIKRLAPYMGNETFMLTWSGWLDSRLASPSLSFLPTGHSVPVTRFATLNLARAGTRTY